MGFRIFAIGDPTEYIAAQTAEEAFNDHLTRAGRDYYKIEDIMDLPHDISEIDPEQQWDFWQEYGTLKQMTWAEFIGPDFVYTEPTLLCWND